MMSAKVVILTLSMIILSLKSGCENKIKITSEIFCNENIYFIVDDTKLSLTDFDRTANVGERNYDFILKLENTDGYGRITEGYHKTKEAFFNILSVTYDKKDNNYIFSPQSSIELFRFKNLDKDYNDAIYGVCFSNNRCRSYAFDSVNNVTFVFSIEESDLNRVRKIYEYISGSIMKVKKQNACNTK